MENIFIEFLPPWVETGLQPAFYDKESGTVLQQVARMYAKMNELIKANHEQGELVVEYIAKFVELKDYVENYFDNLDVQEEINNKLEEMAEQGELAGIIAQFLALAPVFGYNTISDMADADNLSNGCIAKVLGKTDADTGDGSFYRIRTRTGADTPDGENLVAITGDNTIIAQIIPDYNIDRLNEIEITTKNPIYYGADPTGVTDSTQAINDCIQANKGGSVIFSGGTYLISSPIELPFDDDEKVDLIGNGSKIITSSTLETFVDVGFDRTNPSDENEAGFRPCLIENLTFDGQDGTVTYGILNRGGFKDLKVSKCTIFRVTTGVMIGETDVTAHPADVIVDNCMIFGKGSEYAGYGVHAWCSDNRVINSRIYGFRTCFYIQRLTYIINCHGLLRWAGQRISNFNPYPISSAEFDNYYTQTSFIQCAGTTVCTDCYGDSMYQLIDWRSGKCEVTGTTYLNSRPVGCAVINVTNSAEAASPWLIFKNNIFEVPANGTNLTPEHYGFLSNTPINNGAVMSISNNFIGGIGRLSNPFDLITTDYQDGEIYNRRNKRTWEANTWYIVATIANYHSANSNYLSGRFQFNGWEFPFRISQGGISAMYSGSTSSGRTIGLVVDNSNKLAFICAKSSSEFGNINPTFIFDTILNDDGKPIFKINPVLGTFPIGTSMKLSDYNYSDPTITADVKNL